jgi:two-component system, chemotaxis family, sensor kinase CheA
MASDEEELFRTYASDGTLALQDIEESLLGLEKRPSDAEQLNRLYRALHTLKGNSALLGLNRIEKVTHAAEDVVGLVRDRGAQLDHKLVELMLTLKDALGSFVERAGREHRDAGEDDLADLLAEFLDWAEAHGGIEVSEQGATRGEILVWSSLPPNSRSLPPIVELVSGEQSVDQLERVLGVARVALETMQQQLEWLGDPKRAPQQAFVWRDLAKAARSAGELEVAAAAQRMAEHSAALPFQLTNLLAELSALQLLLTELDTRYRAQALLSEDFGVVTLAAQLTIELARDAQRRKAEDLAAKVVAAKPRAPVGAAPEAAGPAPDYLRIDAHKVSVVMELAGEIALACGAVTHHPELAGTAPEGFVAASQKLEMLVRELQNEVSAMRLVPVAAIFQRMKRVVRDTSQRTGKKVELVLIGEDTEIDKVMVDALHDPLVHLVRNAIDHGLETPEERRAAGKSETGTLTLEATHQGGDVLVQVRDDGRGMSRKRIRARAEERGLMTKGAELSDADVLDFVFLPGFSTKENIDELSGRGVGMDVIRTTVQKLRGRVQIESVEGQGSAINMTVPLTLAFVEAMIVSENDQLIALPIEKVIEVFKPTPAQLVSSSADGASMLRVRERLIPVVWLHRYFEQRSHVSESMEGRVIVVVQTSRGMVAVPVQSLLGNQPIMLKPLRGALSRIRSAAGCGMLRSGDVALALDCEGLHA